MELIVPCFQRVKVGEGMRGGMCSVYQLGLPEIFFVALPQHGWMLFYVVLLLLRTVIFSFYKIWCFILSILQQTLMPCTNEIFLWLDPPPSHANLNLSYGHHSVS